MPLDRRKMTLPAILSKGATRTRGSAEGCLADVPRWNRIAHLYSPKRPIMKRDERAASICGRGWAMLPMLPLSHDNLAAILERAWPRS